MVNAGDNLNNIDITLKSEIRKTENNNETKPSSMTEFLDSFSKKSTRRMYREHGEGLKMIPTMQKQIAYLKGRVDKQKPKTEEKPIVSL
jgi:hypothetical protein